MYSSERLAKQGENAMMVGEIEKKFPANWLTQQLTEAVGFFLPRD